MNLQVYYASMEKLEIKEIVDQFFLVKLKKTRFLSIRKDVRALITLSNQMDSRCIYLIKNICKKAGKNSVKNTFFAIAEQIFCSLPENLEIYNASGQIDYINWGRVVALLCFSVEMEDYCKKKGICGNFQLADWCAIALTKRAEWIKNHRNDLMDNINAHEEYENISFFPIVAVLTMLGVGLLYYYAKV